MGILWLLPSTAGCGEQNAQTWEFKDNDNEKQLSLSAEKDDL